MEEDDDEGSQYEGEDTQEEDLSQDEEDDLSQEEEEQLSQEEELSQEDEQEDFRNEGEAAATGKARKRRARKAD